VCPDQGHPEPLLLLPLRGSLVTDTSVWPTLYTAGSTSDTNVLRLFGT
jgi:hypothetical protein